MSGGVGPVCKDIGLPEDQPSDHQPESGTTNIPTSGGHFITFRQLNALAVIIVFSASGMVSIQDFVFVFFSFFYIYVLSKVAFPPLASNPPPKVFQNSKLLGLYVWIGAFVGLFFPIAYIFEGILEGDKEGIKAAAPHVFLLSSQVFLEGVTFSGGFSLPIRVFVPVFYNSKRIFTIFDWVQGEIWKVNEEFGGSARRLQIGRGLAIANLAFWCFNLFCFLLPVYLPMAFKRYYGHKA